MAREIDVRRDEGRPSRAGVRAGKVVPERQEHLQDVAEQVSAGLPGDHEVAIVSFDADSAGAAVLVSRGAEAEDGDYVTRALRHVQAVGPALGLTHEQPAEFVADPAFQETSTGAVAVHLRQQVSGVPVYDAAETVRFDPEGRLLEVAGRSYPAPSSSPVAPRLSAEEALLAAAPHLAEPDPDAGRDPFGESMQEPLLDVGAFAPRLVTATPGSADLASVFEDPQLDGPVTVALVWFPLEDDLVLCWHFRVQVAGGPEYRVIVDAADGRVLLCRRLTRPLTGRASAVLRAGAPRTEVALPLPAASYGPPVPAGLPSGWPDPWLLNGTTAGACARAVNVAAGSSTVSGTISGGEVRFPAPADPGSPDGLVVNLFVLCSWMHDALYLLGFREADGNFQVGSMGRGGRPGDAVLARVHPGPVWGTANMGTRPDGLAPVMNMGLVSSTGRHTALDPDVVFHEYTHGLTNRLVGGPMNDTALDAEQSGGMGEGWSDYVACTLLGKDVVGDWVVRSPLGIRRHRYTDDFPGTYAQLGTADYSEVHDVGELWCAVLMSLGRRLGAWPALQVVVDALKLTSANPSLLAGRDAVLVALRQYCASHGLDEDTSVADAWDVFARYGMGPGARTDGAALSGIVADFTAPPRPSSSTVRAGASPGLDVPDDVPGGVVSTVQLPMVGVVRAVEVAVDVEHSYVGDLVVTLESPGGRSVVLHDRVGSSGRDLVRTWVSADTTALQELHGEESGGAWSLRVCDLAPGDAGRLRAWSIEVDVGPARPTVHVEAAPGARVPTGDAGLSVPLEVDLPGTVSGLRLELDVTHDAVRDVSVALRGPTGKRVTVHRRRGGGADLLRAVFNAEEGHPLAPFRGLDAQGTWTVVVTDKGGTGSGKVNRVALTCAL